MRKVMTFSILSIFRFLLSKIYLLFCTTVYFTINGQFSYICSIASYLFYTEILAFAFKFLASIVMNGDLLFISKYLKFCILIDFSAFRIKFLIRIIKNGHLFEIFECLSFNFCKCWIAFYFNPITHFLTKGVIFFVFYFFFKAMELTALALRFWMQYWTKADCGGWGYNNFF